MKLNNLKENKNWQLEIKNTITKRNCGVIIDIFKLAERLPLKIIFDQYGKNYLSSSKNTIHMSIEFINDLSGNSFKSKAIKYICKYILNQIMPVENMINNNFLNRKNQDFITNLAAIIFSKHVCVDYEIDYDSSFVIIDKFKNTKLLSDSVDMAHEINQYLVNKYHFIDERKDVITTLFYKTYLDEISNKPVETFNDFSR